MTATTSPSRRRGLSLATRIFLVTSLLIALAVVGAVAFTALVVKRIAREAAVESLDKSSEAQSKLQELRQALFQKNLSQLVSNPELVAYISEAAQRADTASLLDQLGERQREVGFDFAIVLDLRGRVIAWTGRLDTMGEGEDLSRRPLLAREIAQPTAEGLGGLWPEGDDLYYAVAIPFAEGFTVQGYLVAGFALDQTTAEVKELSEADVAFVSMVKQEPRIVATTLDRETAASLLDTLRQGDPEMGQMMGRVMGEGAMIKRAELEVRGEPWLARVTPLRDAAGKPVAATVALVPLRREQESFRDIQRVLLASGLVALLLAFPLSYLFARRTLSPVRRLVAAADAARQGNYDQKIPAGGGGEVGQLAGAFDHLLSDLREKRDMELYIAELSKSFPEPVSARGPLGGAQDRDLLLLGVELKGYANLKGDAGPQATLDRLSAELARVTAAVEAARGEVEIVAGHRLVARFAGSGRAVRAVTAAAAVLAAGDGAEHDGAEYGDDEHAPAVALASGRAVTGPVVLGERAESALVGLPVQKLETLLREAAAGEVLLAREVYAELLPALEQAGYDLAPRRGILSPQPLYVLRREIAERLGSLVPGRPTPVSAAPAAGSAAGQGTLSDIELGTIMAHRFEILSVLGSGGMGVVYKARDRELDDLVALKMLRREAWGDRSQLERLKSELKLARKITHPNVLRTYDFGDIDGIPFISMEYVRGVTLRYLLDQSRRLPYSAGLRLAKQLAAGLGAAHAVGVIHRDIKPENLILEPSGNAKLMDFGIARPVTRLEPGQTQAGWVVGTPQYLAPEQLQGGDLDGRADLYSCGIVLYEMFTGAVPFSAPTQVELLMKHLQEPPPPPSQHWPEIPQRLADIILRCLEKDPGARYRTAADLSRDLEELAA